MFLYMTSVVYCRTFFYILCRRYLIIKKTNSENVTTLKVGVLNVEFALKQIFKKCDMSQMNPKEVFHNTAYPVQLPYIAGHSL